MLQRCLVAALVACVWFALELPANGQNGVEVCGNLLQGENLYSGWPVQPAIPMSVLSQTGSLLALVSNESLESHVVDPLPVVRPVVVASKADYSRLVLGEKGNPGAAEKEKCGSLWFTSMAGLVMTRDRANDVELSFSTAALTPTLLTTQDAAMEWGGGFDIRFGRFFNDRRQAWEVIYWGVFSDAETSDATDPDGVLGSAVELNTALQFDLLSYNGTGNPVTGFFNGAARHRLIRDYEFQNIEVNLWGNTSGLQGGGGLEVGWLGGIRFFRFRDSLHFLTDASDGVFTGAVDELTYSIDTQNRLWGVQLGGLAQWAVKERWNLNAAIKVGLFGNHITNSSGLAGSAGNAFIDDPGGPFDQQSYRINVNKDRLAMLGEIDLGATYQIRDHWRAFLGYRAAAITGVGLSTNQFPTDFSNLPAASIIRSNGSLILHGAYAGIELLY